MKRIAIFCDGTWNRSDSTNVTNVVSLHASVRPRAPGGIEQVAIYQDGVGSGKGSGPLSRLLDRLGGGAFGWGLTRNIVDAYTSLAEVYEPGDEVYLFGFSRGAYTARSLAGMIRNCGLPSADTRHRIDEAADLYRGRHPDDAPDGKRALKFRRGFSPAVATSLTDLQARDAPGQCIQFGPAYVGIWDTVGALGIPNTGFGLARMFNRRYQFHDTDLSSSVDAARHAVAIDERRKSYAPTLWTNLDRLNARALSTVPPYRQKWFPGLHGTVGGSGPLKGLSNATLMWIAEGAQKRGLWFEPARLTAFTAEIDPSDPLDDHPARDGLLFRLLALQTEDREGPGSLEEVSDTARTRWHMGLTPPYRPGALRRVRAALSGRDTQP